DSPDPALPPVGPDESKSEQHALRHIDDLAHREAGEIAQVCATHAGGGTRCPRRVATPEPIWRPGERARRGDGKRIELAGGASRRIPDADVSERFAVEIDEVELVAAVIERIAIRVDHDPIR